MQPTVLGSGGGGGPAWGNQIAADNVAKLALVKLALLHPDTIQSANPEYPGHIATVKAEIDKISAAGKTGPMAVAEYLACLRPDLTHQVQEAMEAFGLRPADVSVRFVFGIPAVWGNDAMARMREAIEASGILTLADGRPAPMDFIAEPGAAALALVPKIARSSALQVRCPPRPPPTALGCLRCFPSPHSDWNLSLTCASFRLVTPLSFATAAAARWYVARLLIPPPPRPPPNPLALCFAGTRLGTLR